MTSTTNWDKIDAAQETGTGYVDTSPFARRISTQITLRRELLLVIHQAVTGPMDNSEKLDVIHAIAATRDDWAQAARDLEAYGETTVRFVGIGSRSPMPSPRTTWGQRALSLAADHYTDAWRAWADIDASESQIPLAPAAAKASEAA